MYSANHVTCPNASFLQNLQCSMHDIELKALKVQLLLLYMVHVCPLVSVHCVWKKMDHSTREITLLFSRSV